MTERDRNQYVPDAVTTPGESLVDALASVGMSQADLAERTGRPKKTINEIIRGKAMITSETAVQFERVLGIPATFWTTREAHYQAQIARLEEERKLQPFVGWPAKFPLKEMRRHKWIPESSSGIELVRDLLRFFGIASPETFGSMYSEVDYQFRISKKHEIDQVALAAWLRRGEMEAQETAAPDFDRQRFIGALSEARKLTHLSRETLIPKLKLLCLTAGVVVAFVDELPRIRTNGATRWISSTKALIQLSFRYKRSDILWFTFFHEAGHILLHGKKEIFVEATGPAESEKEHEADVFAADTLLPRQSYEAFTTAGDFTEGAVNQFAKSQGVHSGIVVGRLQHDKLIAHNQLTHLVMRMES